MNLKKLFLSIMFLATQSVVVCPAMPPAGADGNPNMALTPEGAEIMEAALQEFAQAWEKMAPEEREQFFKIYDEMAQLPPEELSKMVNDQYGVQVFAPSEPDAPAAGLPAQELAPELTQPERTITPPKAVTPESKQKEATAMLSSIIERINSFLHKAQIMPEFAGKLRKWTEQGKIKGWHPELKWDRVKKDIESLVQTLEKINEKDKKAKTFKFLNDLIENETVYSNLSALNSALKLQEPAIYIEELGLEPMSKESRKAMRTVIGTLLEALYTLAIPADLSSVIEKYEPIAKKSREQEEAATKKAIEDSKKERLGRPGITAGYGDESEPYYGGGASYDPYGGGSYGGGNYGGGYSPYGGGYEPFRDQAQAVSDDSKSKGEADKSKTPAQADGADKAEKNKEDGALSRIVNKIDSSLDEAAKAITADESRLRDIQKHLLDAGAPDQNTASNALPTAIKRIKTAADEIDRLKTKIKKGGGKSAQYKKDVKDLYEEHQKTFDEMLKQIKQAKGSLGQTSQAKKIAFWGQVPPAAQKPQPTKQTVEGEAPKAPVVEEAKPAGRSLYELEKAIEDLKNAISGL